MDNRKVLQPGSVLRFPGMVCTIEEEIGRGSNAVVYKGWYPDLLNRGEKHIVLIKELFPYSSRGDIRRDEQGCITFNEDGAEAMELHRMSFESGNRIHLKMLEKYPAETGENVNTYEANGTYYTILGYTGGRGLDREINGGKNSLAKTAKRMIGLLDALESFHESGFLHLDIAPDNILLIGRDQKERVMLIDYNSVYDLSTGTAGSEKYYSKKQGYTAPEIRSGKGGRVGFSADLYSVAAVFYCCLTGAPLTSFQMIRPTPPDVSDCEALRDMPETAAEMVRQILVRGLHSLPGKRYQTVGEMREALQELIDRIDGVGITQWALWEAGKKTVASMIRDNTSYAFLKDAESLFPSNISDADGRTRSFGEYIEQMTGENGAHTLLTASGGMGKTTAMLRVIAEQPSKYSPARPAIAYVSLYGWNENNRSYIIDRILTYMKAPLSVDDSRQALRRLLEKPIVTKNGIRPVLLLFIDGLNEADGETKALTDEITELSRLEGVRILAASRSDDDMLPFVRRELSPLTDEDVCGILAARGLMIPEGEDMRILLRTPLMLSMFLSTSAQEEKQIFASTQHELLDAYFDALIKKELQGLPEDTDVRWQVEAAVKYVLPSFAGEMKRKGRALSDGELAKIIGGCYRLFSSPFMRRVFPQWIGRSRAVRGEAKNADEWYEMIVHELLWKKLGLIVRDTQNHYRIMHQIIGDRLCETDARIRADLGKLRGVRNGLYGMLAAAVVGGGAAVYNAYVLPIISAGQIEEVVRIPYPENLAEPVFVGSVSAYAEAGTLYEKILAVLDSSGDPEEFIAAVKAYERHKSAWVSIDAEGSLEKMLPKGEVMPWSMEELDVKNLRELLSLADSREEEYDNWIAAYEYHIQNDSLEQKDKDEYLKHFRDLVKTDADISAVLYQIVCAPHMTGIYAGDTVEARSIDAYLKGIALQNGHLTDITDPELLKQELIILHGQRDEAKKTLKSCRLYLMYYRDTRE